jgi:hypothetical protein
MGKLNKIGKTILRKERILNYSKKRDFISKLEQDHENASFRDNLNLLQWYIKGDDISDIREFKEFLETSDYQIKYFKYNNIENEIQCVLEVTCKELNKNYYYRLLGFLVYHGNHFFCEILGIGLTTMEAISNLETFE